MQHKDWQLSIDGCLEGIVLTDDIAMPMTNAEVSVV
jgi:hypothetical protein